MSIAVAHLSKIYGEQKAVNDISFTVQRGEIAGFLGPNGAGKSTTMKIITGFLPATAGEVRVAGIDVQKEPLQVKSKIGYLPESNPLYYDMYVREYLAFIAGIHKLQSPAKAIEHSIARVGLTPESKKKIGQLSKGYKQRVGLAAALIHDPEVLILDEPTSGLDPNQIMDIRTVIRELGKDKTVLFSSHIMQEVEAVCDRILIINKGTLVADQSLSTLRTQQQDVVTVSFKEQVPVSVLQQLEGALNVIPISANTWQIQTNDPENIKKQLLQLSLQNNFNIVSLQSETSKLEDIFRTLTRES